jgi:thiopurine S-methyltransferase
MHPDFWHERWQANKIGFHQGQANAALQAWCPTLDVPADATVVVPLAGKSHDLDWLAARGHPTTGIELSPVAVDAFFAERDLTPTVRTVGPFQAHESGRLRMLLGDALATTRDHVAPRAFYDRAATVALPPPLRDRYAQMLANLMEPGDVGLTVLLDYPQDRRQGPPFAISPDEAHRLYGDAFDLTLLERTDLVASDPTMLGGGLPWVHRDVWRLERRGHLR